MRTFRTLWRVLVGALLLSFAFSASAAESKVIKIGTLPWEDVMPLTGIAKRFLEKEGYTVQVTTFADWGIAFSALSRGDVDLMVSQINYVTADYWKRNKDRMEKVATASHGLRQGLVVPAYVPINSIDQLNSIKDQVGGKIIGIEAGSGVMQETANAVKQYGLQYQLVEGSTAAMIAQLQSAIERKQPIVTMLWQPSWMDMKFKVKYLDDPKHVFAPPQTYYWIAKKGWSAANPHAREAMASMFVPIDDITRINTAVNDGKTMDQALDGWWKDHSDLINRWAVLSSN
ncbi:MULTISPECIES: glycine betaine ABC transporter substrate-binding protein [unclassified Paraburkholderia]|uniref:glycine betaine ABC transporter substrate-binding protein n=1 Tax=unclassified Paraburkholderia TaxID=2615204 RepID=UPI002AB0E3A5|nr:MULTISPECIES: glycine betaine ABC transporter substrate-binding protein [unclassified Paraburkholderia]